MKSDRSMSIGSASLFTLVIVLPTMVLLVVLYAAIWGSGNFFNALNRFLDWSSLLPVLIIGVPVHEGIHALSWLWLGKITKKDIRFGVKSLTPYTHCEVPIRASAYRGGAIMPALILGVLPYVIGLGTGLGWFTSFGLMYIFAAGGDLLILWILRGVKGEAMVEDHPLRVGCYVFE